MTDDEAFIRAIVAAPADDAPRLIYSDWLDERGDARAAYLRAAVTWGRHLRDVGTCEKAERQLRHFARSLDPVWVCRVTVPPFGVCCDLASFQDCGTPLCATRIDLLEKRLRIKLPAAYRAFLLNYNGAKPVPDVYEIGYGSFCRVQVFFSLGENLTTSPGTIADDSLEVFAEKLIDSAGRITLFPVAADLLCHQPNEDFEEELRRPYWWHYDWETCLCLKLDTQEIVRAHIDLSAHSGSANKVISVNPVAKSFPVLLSQLDELPVGWEPYSF